MAESEILKLKTWSFYHENLLLEKFNDMITQVLRYFFSVSDIMDIVKNCLNGMKVATSPIADLLWV